MSSYVITVQLGQHQRAICLEQGTFPHVATLVIETLNPWLPARLKSEGYDIHILSAQARDGTDIAGIRVSKLVDEGQADIKLLDEDGNEIDVQRELLDRVVLVPSETESVTEITVHESEVAFSEPNKVSTEEQLPDRPAVQKALRAHAIRIRVWEGALNKAREHARHHRQEVGGICVGTVGRGSKSGRWIVEVTDTFVAEHTFNQGASITFTVDTWSAANRVMDRDYAGGREHMVGWYHTHPGFGVFMSSYDRFVHENFFTQPWHVALVIDPIRKREGFFVWNAESNAIERYENEQIEWLSGSYARKPIKSPTLPVDKLKDTTFEDTEFSSEEPNADKKAV